MADEESWHSLLRFLRELSKSDAVSENSREAAEECRQMLLSLERDHVPDERLKSVQERFIKTWGVFETELLQKHDVVARLDTFALDDDIEIELHMEGSI